MQQFSRYYDSKKLIVMNSWNIIYAIQVTMLAYVHEPHKEKATLTRPSAEQQSTVEKCFEDCLSLTIQPCKKSGTL